MKTIKKLSLIKVILSLFLWTSSNAWITMSASRDAYDTMFASRDAWVTLWLREGSGGSFSPTRST